ncbi:MAG: chemotaxis protein CheX [Oscillospiraceae bacterium]|nr:chemotaxis protein CheX [Oscillospiraceae bacterium]
MDTAMNQEELEEMLDEAVREVTEKASGLQLYHGSTPPSGEICTIHITFKKGFQSSLTLCADASLLTRMASSVVGKDQVTAQDVEDFSKEYLNVLCGKIAARLYKATKVPARFSIPTFHMGHFAPEDQQAQFAITYSDDQQEGAQLIHHIPIHRESEDADQTTTTSKKEAT